MKVLDLQCQSHHRFEGWFSSEEDFQNQLSSGLLECPLCADKAITKMLSAPRLNLAAAKEAPAQAAKTDKPDNSDKPNTTDLTHMPEARLQAAWLKMVRHVMLNTENVGKNFAEEARRIHYGEAEERNIRGQATAEESQALMEEGIAVTALPVPEGMTGLLQ